MVFKHMQHNNYLYAGIRYAHRFEAVNDVHITKIHYRTFPSHPTIHTHIYYKIYLSSFRNILPDLDLKGGHVLTSGIIVIYQFHTRCIPPLLP
jgi:hypothetical protein